MDHRPNDEPANEPTTATPIPVHTTYVETPKERFPYMGYREAIMLSVALLVLQVFVGLCLTIVLMVPRAVLLIMAGDEVTQEALANGLTGPLMLGNLITVVPVLVWCMRRSRERFAAAFALRRAPLGTFLATVPVALGFAILLSEMDNFSRTFFPVPNFFGDMFAELLESPFWWFAAVVVIAPLTEEFVFRGAILRGLLRRKKVWPAIIVSSLLFALIHLNPAQIPVAVFVGVALGWFLVRTGSLWPCIALHAMQNSIPLIITWCVPWEIPGFTGMPAPGVFQPWWLDVLGIFSLAAGLFFFHATTSPARETDAASASV